MKIFKIDVDQFPAYLTVDSTLITVDSTLITADMTILDTYPYKIKVIPRITSQNVQVILKNEIKQSEDTLDILYFQYDGEYLCVYFDYPFEDGDSFEIKIINLNEADPRKNLMWRGKGYATTQEDMENFKLALKDDDGKIRLER